MKKHILAIFIVALLVIPETSIARTPNDPKFVDQWYLKNIHAPEAWNQSTGNGNVIVAVIDTGVELEHPDLKENLWKNKKEIPDDGKDNDHNGFIDDYDGWDFIDHDHDPSPSGTGSMEDKHGTMVAGLIGAIGNNATGITGVNWRVRIMPIRAMAADGGGETTVIAKAIDYAVRMKANIINLSVVGFENDPVLQRSIEHAWKKGVLIVAAAGNEGVDLNKQAAYPVCMTGSRGENMVLGVAALNESNQLLPGSNFGSRCIDLAAPGMHILSTSMTINGAAQFEQLTGTSMAAPLVSGAAALIKSKNPALSNKQLRDILRSSAVPVLRKNKLWSGAGKGVLNIGTAMRNIKKTQGK